MTTQINLRFDDEFLEKVRNHAKSKGFLNIQEFIREAVREKIYEEDNLNVAYLQRLHSKEAQTFVSEDEAQSYEKELEKRANL
ncbi:MAG: ribbon-helix-helix domain-containing protein [Candidatus Woesearchaeota archaeon]